MLYVNTNTFLLLVAGMDTIFAFAFYLKKLTEKQKWGWGSKMDFEFEKCYDFK